MSYDQGLLERCHDTLQSMRVTARDKNVFGMRGLLIGKTMFAAVGEAGLIVKLPSGEFSDALQLPGVRAFTPGGEKLGTWVEVDAEVVADDPELRHWLQTGLRGVR